MADYPYPPICDYVIMLSPLLFLAVQFVVGWKWKMSSLMLMKDAVYEMDASSAVVGRIV